MIEFSPEDVIAKAIEPFGFKKRRKNHWYRYYPEVTQIIALQKSRWGPQYSLYLALWLNELEPEEKPLWYKSHLKCWLDHLSQHGNLVDSALDFEEGWKMDFEERCRILQSELFDAELDFFGRVKSKAQVFSFVRTPWLKGTAINRELVELVRS